MKKRITSESIPICMWIDEIESGALEQAKNLANLPFAFRHVVILPDCHQGYGMPIGGVLATSGNIIPNAVGVDIGCGMSAIKTSLTHLEKNIVKTLMSGIRDLIPLGFKHHKKPQDENCMPVVREGRSIRNMPVVNREYESALCQIGTLGGGNHFIEIQKGSDGYIWMMVHSGSRNIGKQVADYYNRIAISLNERWDKNFSRAKQLAYLPVDSDEGNTYLEEMDYCVRFAFSNRSLMIERIKSVFLEHLNMPIVFDPMINIAHNFASCEDHFGERVYVHRKGATQAKKDQVGIIPGSQGTRSYIVKGKGNPESFESCSHGAGRVMGRKQAQRQLNLEKEIRSLEKKDIIHSIRTVRDLDEAPSAYKDIDMVMENQKDLVDTLVELTPLAVIKG
ncbi:MAG: RtcB family protein [Bacteroidales bacterium]|nr:MAG: RtcB family protein [Bacteroidales bacterium]